MKNAFHESQITIFWFDFKRKIIFVKEVILWLFANIPRMLGKNILLTWFECQWFNWTTKVDTIHIVNILVLTRLHPHISYWRLHMWHRTLVSSTPSQSIGLFWGEHCFVVDRVTSGAPAAISLIEFYFIIIFIMIYVTTIWIFMAIHYILYYILGFLYLSSSGVACCLP